jgi:hypothetical protein
MADIEEKIQINRKIFTKRFDLSFFALAKNRRHYETNKNCDAVRPMK